MIGGKSRGFFTERLITAQENKLLGDNLQNLAKLAKKNPERSDGMGWNIS